MWAFIMVEYMRKCRKETAVIEVINKADTGFLNSASALSIIKRLKKIYMLWFNRYVMSSSGVVIGAIP